MVGSRLEAKQAVLEIAGEQLAKANRTLGGSLQSNIESWTDSRSAIIELLQNADDVGARRVHIDITYRGVRFSHDGSPLERGHVAALCDVRQSTKDVETQTGFKGIGFKAVFLISDAPMVRQGPWSFEFRPGLLPEHGNSDPGLCWYLIPRWVEEPPTETTPSLSTDTLFWLPYSARFDEEAQQALRDKLIEDLHAACMLFLRSVRQIHLRAGDLSRRMVRDGDNITDAKPKKTVKRKFLTAAKHLAVPEGAKKQLRLDDPRRGVTHRDLQLAFELTADGKLTEVPPENALYYVFLPSEEPTQLPFLIQGDFLLDTQRSKLQENNSWNRWLHEETLQFVTEQLTSLAAKDNLADSLLAILPQKRQPGHRDAEKHLLQPLYSKIAELPILRAYGGDLVAPNKACMSAEPIAALLDAAWLAEAKKRSHFIPELEGHIQKLKAYGTETLSPADAIQGVFRAEYRPWLNTRTAAWFTEFYTYLSKHVYAPKGNAAAATALSTATGLVILSNNGLAPPATVFLQPANPAIADLMARLPECPLIPKEHMAHSEVLAKLGVHPPQLDTLCKKLVLAAGTQTVSNAWTDDQYQAALGLLNEWWRGTGGEPDEEARAAIRSTRGEFRLRTTDGIHPAKSVYISSPVINAFPVPRVEAKPDTLGLLRDLGATTAPRLLAGSAYPTEYKAALQTRHGPINSFPNNQGWFPWPNASASEEIRKRLLDLLLEEPKAVDGPASWRNAKAHLGFRVTDVESFATWQTRNTNWIPTTQGLAKAGEPLVWPEDKTTSRLARDILPIVLLPGAWRTGQKERIRPFLLACNIHFEPSLDTLLEILTRLDAIPVEWKQRAAATYQEIVRLLNDQATVPAAVTSILERLRLPLPSGQLAEAKTLYWADVVRAEILTGSGVLAWRPDLPRRDLDRLFQFLRVRPASRDLKVTPIVALAGEPDSAQDQNLRWLRDHVVAIACHHGATERDARAKLDRLEIYRLNEPIAAKVELGAHSQTTPLHAHVDGSRLFSTFEKPIQTAVAIVQYLGIASDAVQVIAYILQSPGQADEMLQSSGIPFVRRIELDDAPEATVDGVSMEQSPPAHPSSPTPAPVPNQNPPAPMNPVEPRIIVPPPALQWTPQVRPETAVGKLVNWNTPSPRVSTRVEPTNHPALPPVVIAPTSQAPVWIFKETDENQPEDIRREIGKWGEGFVHEELVKRLRKEFPEASIATEGTDTTFTQGTTRLATLRWHNRLGESGRSPDIVLKYGETRAEYIEVKTTAVHGGWAEFTAPEWQLARDHPAGFFVYRVWNAGRPEVDYSIITDVERRWRTGEIPQYRIKLQLQPA
jgi:hypothetical protein